MFLAAPESLCLPSLLPLRCPPGKGPVHIHPHPRPSQIPAHWTIMRTLNCPTHLMDEDAKAQAGLRFPGSQDECRGCRDLHSGPRGCNCLEPLSTRCSRRSRSVPLRRHRDCRFPCPQLPRSGGRSPGSRERARLAQRPARDGDTGVCCSVRATLPWSAHSCFCDPGQHNHPELRVALL